ncbi:penicillin-binding protein 2 [bacterium]|nr:penicillin-binding protein 2 [bacterium]
MKDKYANRAVSIIAIITILALVIVSRLVYIQVFAKEYKQFAEQNTRSKKTVIPTRGLILDRNAKRLVSNETVYDLVVVLKQTKEFDTTALCQILKVEKSYLRQKFAQFRAESRYYTPTVFLRELPAVVVARLQERKFDFRGFYVKARIGRRFEYPVAAHVLGYLGEVDQKEIEASDGYYELQNYIGKSGLEKQYEQVLRGKKGYEYTVVDKFNREIGSYANGEFDIAAEPGKNLTSTIDVDLQAYGELLMKNKIGAIVAIEPSTGEILAMVSSPTFDPTMLVGRKRSEFYPKISTDPNKPLYNRAITGMYPPGSTFKPIMALVGLQEGVITQNSRFPCHMGYTIPGLHVGCHSHVSNLNLIESIAQSCNSYYCHTFRNTIDQQKFADTEEGFQNWRNYMLRFGLGQRLGIDIPNEVSGIMPTVEKFDGVYGEGRWRSSYIISLAIGQAEISLTPLQMANMTAVIANRGYYYTPHLVKDPIINEVTRHNTGISEENFNIVVEGMAEVFRTGTARWYALPEIEQCGKTGTAENPHGEDHSNFIAFAPRQNPKIAIAVVVENGGFGATWAAPIASLMIEKYLTDTITRPHFEQKMLEKDFIHVADTSQVTPHAQ